MFSHWVDKVCFWQSSDVSWKLSQFDIYGCQFQENHWFQWSGGTLYHRAGSFVACNFLSLSQFFFLLFSPVLSIKSKMLKNNLQKEKKTSLAVQLSLTVARYYNLLVRRNTMQPVWQLNVLELLSLTWNKSWGCDPGAFHNLSCHTTATLLPPCCVSAVKWSWGILSSVQAWIGSCKGTTVAQVTGHITGRS